jgi:hypothetical protein
MQILRIWAVFSPLDCSALTVLRSRGVGAVSILSPLRQPPIGALCDAQDLAIDPSAISFPDKILITMRVPGAGFWVRTSQNG